MSLLPRGVSEPRLPDHSTLLVIAVIGLSLLALLMYYVVIPGIRFSMTHEIIHR